MDLKVTKNERVSDIGGDFSRKNQQESSAAAKNSTLGPGINPQDHPNLVL